MQRLIKKLTKEFGTVDKIFKHTDGFQKLPFGQLLLCKEVLQHLSNSDASRLLKMINGPSFVIITNGFYKLKFLMQFRTRYAKLTRLTNFFYSVRLKKNNMDISSGDYRGIDLQKFPSAEIINVHYELIEIFTYQVKSNPEIINKTYVFKYT